MKLASLILIMAFLFENYLVTSIEQISKNEEGEEANIDLFSKCYDELGCVEADSRWYDKKLRPVNLIPMDRHIIKTDFLLMKLNNSGSGYLLYNSIAARYGSIKSAGFNKKHDTFILIHDFTGNGYTGWIKHLTTTMLSNSPDVNIISVDWQRGAEPPYDQAISNARVVALEIIALLKELKEKFHMNFGKICIIGHGVGAHIAGYVGTVYNNIKKITGLDPSGPRFEGLPDIVKLNPTNARYVEVIHTDAYDARSQGTKETMGHSDFYINDAFIQPGCPVNKSFSDLASVERNTLNEGEILPGCSHKRSFKYFIESMFNGKCIFLGIKCNNYEDFAKGKCATCGKSDSLCRTFGIQTYKSSKQKSSYFLNTADHSPYCMFQYRITVSVTKGENNYYGYFDFILVDDNANVAEASLSDSNSNNRDFKSGFNNTYVYYAQPPKLGKIKEAKVRWNENKKFYCFIYCKQAIYVESVVIKFLGTGRDDEGVEESLCSTSHGTEIENGSYRTFITCTNSSESSISTSSSTFNSTSTSTSTFNSASTLPSTSTFTSSELNKRDKNG